MVGLGRLVLAAVLLAALAACGESSNGSSSGGTTVGAAGANLGTAAVKIAANDAFKFDPAQQSAKVGDIIQWTNTGSANHTVTFDTESSLSDPALNQGGTWQVRFSAAGTYHYTCTIHAGMTGTITIS